MWQTGETWLMNEEKEEEEEVTSGWPEPCPTRELVV